MQRIRLVGNTKTYFNLKCCTSYIKQLNIWPGLGLSTHIIPLNLSRMQCNVDYALFYSAGFLCAFNTMTIINAMH